MKNIKNGIIICFCILALLIGTVFFLKPKKSIDSKFEVTYMSAERFEEIVTNEFNATLSRFPETAKPFTTEYNIYDQQVGSMDFTVYTCVDNRWGLQTCNYYLFETTEDAYMYFDIITNRFASVLSNNEYHIDETEGYCLVNASGLIKQKYAAYYFKDDMVITITQSGYSIFPSNKTVMNKICGELGVETPIGIPRNEEVRKIYYSGITGKDVD